MILPPPKYPPAPTSIDEILASEDELNLLANVQPMGAKVPIARGNDTKVNNFLEIVDFVSSSGREPDINNLSERSLARRLKKYREDEQLRAAVAQYDTLGLLGDAPEEAPSAEQVQEDRAPTSLEDIFTSDDLGLLDDINYDIFNLEHVKASNIAVERDIPDIIGRQRPCANFERYREFFDRLAQAMKSTSVIRRPFTSESSLRPGQFFLLRGQLCYIAAKLQDGDYKGRDNPRLLVIFDNHTEIEILKLSLARALYADKQSKWLDCAPNLLSVAKQAAGEQKQVPHKISGYIYILETLSTAPELASWKHSKNLVKIGFTTTSIEKRLRNAERDRTYLCAPVKLIHSITCYDMNTHKFEKIIHAFLNDQRLSITMIDKEGRRYRPEEWFTVSAETALQVANHIADGTISQYRLDNVSGSLKRR